MYDNEDDDDARGVVGGGDDGYLARSDELKSFHETLSRLQQIEDQVMEEHREIIQVGVACGCGMGVVCVSVGVSPCYRYRGSIAESR